ncbi:MAG: hypothetical protein IPK26_04670 [Planctomycetes bacterium]|nr:hypothetical protein [Planctomycetota bacterium]
MTTMSTDMFDDPNALWLDEPQPGELWARGRNYKASFDPRGWQFIPFLGSDAPRNFPLHLSLASVRIDGDELPLATGKVSRRDRSVAIDRGSVREQLDLTGASVEQTFVFDRLPQRGALAVTIDVTTELVPTTVRDGLLFSQPGLGGVRYEHAIVKDADGRSLSLPIVWAQGAIRLDVPADFVATARLPLLVDPLLSTMLVQSLVGTYVGDPDTCAIWYGYQRTISGVVWQQTFSGSDVDVWGRFYDDATPRAGATLFPLDITTTSWALPRIAMNYDGAFGHHCMVSQCSNGGVPPFWIGGRIVNAGLGVLPQFRISPVGRDCTNPDVGCGDRDTAMDTTFTVVYEFAYSQSDHDIYCQQVDVVGNVAAGIRFVDTSTAFESRPRIANRASWSSWTKFPVVYERTVGGDVDIRGGFLGWDGQPTHLFAVSTGGNYDHRPVVSSFTDTPLDSHALFVWERVGGGDTEIFGAVFDDTGAWRTSADLNRLEDPFGSRPTWAQFGPSVDCDGARFAVTYTENFANNVNDPDAVIATFGFTPFANRLEVIEPHRYLAATGAREYATAVAAARPHFVPHYMAHTFVAACQRDQLTPGTASVVQAFLFDGAQPFTGYTTRATACGNALPLTPPPNPAYLGATLLFSMTAPPGFAGLLFGFPASLPIGPCPGCMLGVDGITAPNPYVHTLTISPAFVGVTMSVQGFSFGGGSCLGAISVSDTLDFTIR